MGNNIINPLLKYKLSGPVPPQTHTHAHTHWLEDIHDSSVLISTFDFDKQDIEEMKSVAI